MNAQASIRTHRFTPGFIALVGLILLTFTVIVDAATDLTSARAAEMAAEQQVDR